MNQSFKIKMSDGEASSPGGNTPRNRKPKRNRTKRILFSPGDSGHAAKKATGTGGPPAVNAPPKAVTDIEGIIHKIADQSRSIPSNQKSGATQTNAASGSSTGQSPTVAVATQPQVSDLLNLLNASVTATLARSEESECGRVFQEIRSTFFAVNSNIASFHDPTWSRFVSNPDLRGHPALESRFIVLKEQNKEQLECCAALADRFLSSRNQVTVDAAFASVITPTIAELAALFFIIQDSTHRWSVAEIYNILSFKVEQLRSWSLADFRRHTKENGTSSIISLTLHGRNLPTQEEYRGIQHHIHQAQERQTGVVATRNPLPCRNCGKTATHEARNCPAPCTWCPKSSVPHIKSAPPHARKDCKNWTPNK